MGHGEAKDKDDSIRGSQRKLYRQGSLSSQITDQDGNISLGQIANDRGSIASSRGTLRQRTPSGKSIRSRTASRVEYHEDLKPVLRQGLTRNLLLHSLVILMGSSFLFGYNIGVLNQPSQLIRDFYNETYTDRYNEPINSYKLTFLWSLTTAFFLPGGMIGAFSAGFLADKVGRKRAVLFSHIPAFIGAILSTICVAAKVPELLMIGRFVTGINCGFATQLAPMYLAEITPFNLRGAFGTANQLFVTIGIFMGSILGLTHLLGTRELWPYLLLLNAGPALLSLVALPFLPDSPRYLLLVKNRRVEAEKALRFLRQEIDVTADIEEMETEMTINENRVDGEDEEKYTMKMLLKTKELMWPLAVAIMLQIIQQLSGINAIFFYSKSIFKGAAVPEDRIEYAVIGTNAVNVLMTLVAVPIMDVAGRRPLLLYPMMCMIVILGAITAALKLQNTIPEMSYLSITCVIAYVICFAVGLGPIPMMIAAELFRQGPRPRAMSLAGLANWLFTLIVAISFELIQEMTKEYTFVIFLILMIFFTIFVFVKVPETKNKTFEEIASVFQPGGDIEVEEIVDDVFEEKDVDEPEEGTRLMQGDDRIKKNGSVSRSASASAENVTIDFKRKKSEDKMSLTKSEENVANVDV